MATAAASVSDDQRSGADSDCDAPDSNHPAVVKITEYVTTRSGGSYSSVGRQQQLAANHHAANIHHRPAVVFAVGPMEDDASFVKEEEKELTRDENSINLQRFEDQSRSSVDSSDQLESQFILPIETSENVLDTSVGICNIGDCIGDGNARATSDHPLETAISDRVCLTS
jgi:hypothetical protein